MEKYWSLDEVASLKGKVIIVTGGNSGVGFESVKAFAKKGATVIMGCRSMNRGNEAKDLILSEVSDADVKVFELDLADLASVKNFANKFLSEYKRLDVLLNNAGIANSHTYIQTKDGVEQHMAINYIGHFALTGLLFDVLKATPSSRVVNISSLAHYNGKTDFEELLYKNEFTPMDLYGSSKLGNLFLTYELDRRIKKAGLDMKSLAAHPGASRTNLSKDVDPELLAKMDTLMQDADQGALPGLRAALDANAEGSMYFGPEGENEYSGQPVLIKSSELSHNIEAGKMFFDKTEKFTGISFNFDTK